MARERIMRARAAGSGSVARCRFQCRTMPNWLSVKETNTPTMYSWISLVTCASNAQISTAAPAASTTIPLEYASRSPRVCSWRGRNPSRARIEPSTGKPLKAVFAASTRIRPVTTETRATAGVNPENTAVASWPSTGCCR